MPVAEQQRSTHVTEHRDGATDGSSGARTHPRAPSARSVVAVCVAEILSMAGYATVPALLPQLMAEFSLSSAQGGWLAGMMFAGYMLGNVPFFKAHFSLIGIAIILVSVIPAIIAAVKGGKRKTT